MIGASEGAEHWTGPEVELPACAALCRRMTGEEFEACVMTNPANGALIGRLAGLGLGDCYLTAGCLYQTVWNQLSGRPPEWGIKDYDIFYFDDGDLSWEAEDRVIRVVDQATSDLGIKVEVRNQARVHLWYPARFGGDCPAFKTVREGIDSFLIACTCVGIDVDTGAIHAPHGFADLAAGLLRMNPLNPRPEQFHAKAVSVRERWPWLTIEL